MPYSLIVQLLAYGVGLELAAVAACGGLEGFPRLQAQVSLGWLLLAPLLWLISSPPPGAPSPMSGPPENGDRPLRAWALAIFVSGVALAMSYWASVKFGDLPPGIHDEYSYLFQAETFLQGRLWFPSHPTAREAFEQIHVLNDGKFASRYFPGTALWLCPFLAVGHPYGGYWLANALVAGLTFAAGRELAGNRAGLIAGLVIACSPGMAIFSNLLLSSLPTSVGLMLFLFAFLRMQRGAAASSIAFALLAGCGLGFAMLCRPLTAAAVGFPFGAWWVVRLARPGRPAESARIPATRRLALALAAPVLACMALQAAYDQELTGSPWETPYQRYTDQYTPRHVYGFNNVVRGERRQTPNFMDAYDRWAQNLTIDWALDHALERLENSWRWTLGCLPLLMATVVVVLAAGQLRFETLLIFAAICCLHAAYFPYWFTGIMRWHYVFESGPLWALLLAAATEVLFNAWRRLGRRAMPYWWAGLLGSTALMTYAPLAPNRENSDFERELAPYRAMRQEHAKFQALLTSEVRERPALVLVSQPPANFHTDFVVNRPDLTGDILLARQPADDAAKARLAAAFPARVIYEFNEREWWIRKASRPAASARRP